MGEMLVAGVAIWADAVDVEAMAEAMAEEVDQEEAGAMADA